MSCQHTICAQIRRSHRRIAATIISVLAGYAAWGAVGTALPLERAVGGQVPAPRALMPKANSGLESKGIAGNQRDAGIARRQDFSSVGRLGSLTTLAREQISKGLPVAGALLALEALSNATGKDRTRLGEAQWGAAIAGLEAGLRTSRERALLSGHEGTVYCVAVSPDGKWLVTGSADNTARIWDAETGNVRTVLSGHEGGVRAIAVSPDGAFIVTGSSDLTARVWDSKTGKELLVLKGHKGNILSVAWSPDGAKIFTGSGDHSVRIWDSRTGEELAVLKGHHESVGSIAISPDGLWFVTGSDDATARIWNARSGQSLGVLKGHDSAVYSVAIFPHGARRIVTAAADGSVRIWDPKTAKEVSVVKGHHQGIRSLAVSPDGRSFVTGSDDKSARIWDGETGRESAFLGDHDGAVLGVAVSPDGTWIVTGSSDRTARIWETKTGAELVTLRGHRDNLTRVAMSANGARIVTGSDDNTARLWDARTGEELAVLKGHGGPILSIAVSLDGRRVVTGSKDKTARVWDAGSGAELAVLKGHAGAVTAVAMNPEGTWIITASEDHTARIWGAETGKERARLTGHQDSVTAVAISPDGSWAATGSSDGTARIWNAPAGKQRMVLKSGAIYSLAVSSDGTRLITGSWDRTARIWDIRTGRQLAALRGHKGAIYDVVISPDRTWIVSGSADNVARIWDAVTGAERLALRGHERPVHSVAVSSDGSRVVTGSWDHTARIWDSSTGRELAILRGHDGAVNDVLISPDGARIVTVSTDNTARIWRSVPASADALIAFARRVVPRCLTIHERAKLGIDSSAPEWCHELQKWPYDPITKFIRAKEELAAGREEMARSLFATLETQSASLKQRIDAAWTAHFIAAADKHLAAGENDRAIDAYARFLLAAESQSSFEQQVPLALLRRGIAHYRLTSFPAALSDIRRSAALGQTNAGYWLWTAINGTADKLYGDGQVAAALIAMLGNYSRLSKEDRRYIKTDALKTSLWRMSYALSQIFAETSGQTSVEMSGQENQCDRLAAHANDPFKIARGVQFEEIKSEAAITACTAIIEAGPDEPRFYLQRARAYAKAKQYENEIRDLEVAMAKGYPMAFNNMGYAYLRGNGVNKSAEKGASLYLETFNRIVRCCGVPVARHLISLRNLTGVQSKDLRAAAYTLLDWGARLGDPNAHQVLAALYTAGELSAGDGGGNRRLTAYYHSRIAEKLLLSGSNRRAAEPAGKNARALAENLSDAEIKSLDDAIRLWRTESFTALPPWITE